MNKDSLKAVGDLLPVAWMPLLAGVFLIFTILAWCLPAWRGNALSAIPGFLASLGGLWYGRWVALHEPSWARWTLRQLHREGLQTSWIDLRPHMGFMFMTLVAGGLAYCCGMLLGKFILRAWVRYLGSTIPEGTDRSALSPFH